MSPFPTVYRGQHDTQYATFELLLHAAFVADCNLGFYAWTSAYELENKPRRRNYAASRVMLLLCRNYCYEHNGYNFV